MKKNVQRSIEVWADWVSLGGSKFMGTLFATASREKEIFSFEYDADWLKRPHAQSLDPSLSLFEGPQYAPIRQSNFGVFLNSCPDRRGCMLMNTPVGASATFNDAPITMLVSRSLCQEFEVPATVLQKKGLHLGDLLLFEVLSLNLLDLLVMIKEKGTTLITQI